MKHLYTEKVVPIEANNPAIKIDYDNLRGVKDVDAAEHWTALSVADWLHPKFGAKSPGVWDKNSK